MNQCLNITFALRSPKDFLQSVVQKNAKSLGIEGVAQYISAEQVRIVICGSRDAIDDFLDVLHKEVAKASIEEMHIEPFLKEKDYRGVFRILE